MLLFSADATVIVAVPFPMADTTPFSTVATALSLLVHVTALLVALLGSIDAVRVAVSPASKDRDDLSKEMFVNTYQSKVGVFNHDNMFLKKGLKLGNSPYEIVIDNKQRNEVQISLLMPKEKTPINHNFQAFIFVI